MYEKHVLALVTSAVAVLLSGCSATKTVDVHTQAKMITGQQMSCIYHADNLYCASPLLKAEDIDKLQLMTKVVSVVSEETKESDLKEGGSFSTKFATKPKEYSVWNCANTGVAEPAIKCTLLREANQKLVAQQEEQIKLDEEKREQEAKLNHAQEAKLQNDETEQSIIAACGSPIEQRNDSISHTVYFPSTHSDVLVEVRFNTLGGSRYLEHIESVDTSKDHKFFVEGIFWNNFVNIGSTDEDHVAPIRDYFPCVFK